MILVTGANGFLGRHICQAIPAGELCTLSRTDAQLHVDISKPFSLPDREYTTVIHAAGKAHSIPRTDEAQRAFYETNVTGTAHLLQALEQLTQLPRAFVLISTVAVYGLEEGNDIKENTPLNATTVYGKSKIAAESLVQQWCNKHRVRCTILRLPLLAGDHAPGNLGRMQEAIRKGRYYNIGGGKAQKSMVLAADVAKVIIPLSSIGGTYHLTDGQHPTFTQLSSAMAKKMGQKAPMTIPGGLAKMIAAIGAFIPGFPLNSAVLQKMTADLTFNDDQARKTGLWHPQPVLDFYR